MGTSYTVKQHDYGLPLVADVSYRNTALDITDTLELATPTVFTMTPEGSVAPVIYRAPATITALDTPNKTVTVQYDWRPPNLPTVSGDTEIAGRYKAEFEFDLTGGPATAPTGGYLAVYILPDLDSTAADLPANTVTAIDAHVAQADPHPGYTTTAELAAAAALLAPIASPAFTGTPTAPTLSLTGATPALTVGTAAGNASITLNANAPGTNAVTFQRAGVANWLIYDAAGADLLIRNQVDAHTQIQIISAATDAAAFTDLRSNLRVWGPNADVGPSTNKITIGSLSTSDVWVDAASSSNATVNLQLRAKGAAGQIVSNTAHRFAANVGFYNAAPVAKPTGVAVSAPGIHAALVTLGLIAA